MPDGSVNEKRMRLRYEGTCRVCGAHLPVGKDAIYERAIRTVRCIDCVPLSEDVVPGVDDAAPRLETGVAGASARREHERRRARDEERLREKWGRLVGVAAALANERRTTKVWAQGAVGEEMLGSRLDRLVCDEIAVLHDRRIARTRANIDHLVVTAGGVWVIDAKRYKDQRPELRIEGGLLRPRVEKLVVGRRDQTKLVDGMLRQVDLVRDVLGEIPVVGALCFVDADWPLVGGAFQICGVHVVPPRRLMRLIGRSAGSIDVDVVGRILFERFRPA